MIRRCLLIAGLASGPVTPLGAQDQAVAPTLTPDALQGPPTPAAMYAIAGMDDGQLERYAAAYRAHMAGTWEARSQVVSAVRMLDRALQASDTDAVRYYYLLADQLWLRLRTRDEGFDDALKALLDQGQLRRYHAWREAWLRASRIQYRAEPGSAMAEGGDGPTTLRLSTP